MVQRLESAVPVGLEEAGKPSHVRRRTLATAVGAVEVGGCRRSVAAERPVVAHVDPQPPGLGAAEPRRQHRDCGVIAMDLCGGEDMALDPGDHRIEQPGRLADPVAQGRAVEVQAFPGVDLGLAMQRQVVTVLRHQQMCQQARCGAATWRGHRRCRGLGNGVARIAGIFRPDVADDLEVPGHVVEHLSDVFTQSGHAPAACGTGAGAVVGRLMHHLLARQMIRQRLARRLVARADGGRRIGGLGLGGGFGGFGFQRLEPQFELGDLVVDPLRRAAELHAPQLGNLELELFDLQGLVLHRQLGRLQRVLAGQGEGTQRGGIGGQFSRGERHDQV
jgi:hypothetical protein